MLFDSKLISKDIQAQLPPNYEMRPLSLLDYEKGFVECLSQLTVTGTVTKHDFIQTFNDLKRAGNYLTIVIEDRDNRKIVGAGTVFIEQKFTRSCGKAAHIEDIVVHDSQRGKKLGIRIIDQLKYISVQLKCYKVTLNCSKDNIKFYEKCGLDLKDFQMTFYPKYEDVKSGNKDSGLETNQPSKL